MARDRQARHLQQWSDRSVRHDVLRGLLLRRGTVFDLNDPYYGIVGNRSRDDTTRLNQLLADLGGAIAATEGASTSIVGSSGGVTDSGLVAVGAAGGMMILPSRKQCFISGTLYAPANCVIEGQGRGSVIYHTGSGAAIKYTRPSGGSDGYAAGVVLRDFMIFGTDGAAGQHGIECRYATLGMIQNVVVEHCGGHGVWLNEHTVGMMLVNVRCMDNGLAQLFLDGIAGGTYQNCDSHVIVGGRFFCNTRGTHSVRLRRTIDTAFYHPLIAGSTATANIGIRLEGAQTVDFFGAFCEGHGTHLSIIADTVTGQRGRRNQFIGGDWQGGATDHMTVSIDGCDETLLDHINWDAPPPDTTSSVITVGSAATDTLVRGRCERLGLSDSGKNTRFEDDITNARGASGLPIANTNLVGYASRLNSGSWSAGTGISSRTEGTLGPAPGISSTRVVSGTGGTNNWVSYATASGSSGVRHCMHFWARVNSGTAKVNAKLSVPGVGDEIDQPLSLGTSFKRYTVQGPVGVFSGNLAVQFVLPNSTTIDIAGVKCEVGSPTPHLETDNGSTMSLQIGDAAPLGRVIRRMYTLTDGATVNIDQAAGDYFLWSAGGSRTVAAPTNRVRGTRFAVELLNNTGGGITTTWNAAFKFAGAAVDPAAGKKRVYEFLDDGTNITEQSRSPADI